MEQQPDNAGTVYMGQLITLDKNILHGPTAKYLDRHSLQGPTAIHLGKHS